MTLDRTHILLGLGVVLLGVFGVYSLEARIAERASAKAELAQQHAADLEKQNAAFQAATAQQIAVLQSALAAREAGETKVATQSGSLTASQVATQVAQVAKVPEATVTSTADTVTFPLPLAQMALADIQLVPMLQADKSDLQKSLDLEKAAHASEIIACKAEVSAEVARTKAAVTKDRKGALKWFAIGYVAGFISGKLL